jgi:erythromycin esterase
MLPPSVIFLLAAPVIALVGRQASDRFNLGFERSSMIAPELPAGWFVGSSEYEVVLDTMAPHSGTRSLRIAPRSTPRPQAFGVATSRIDGQIAAGKTVRLRGYVRTRDVAAGYAGLWMRVDGPGGRMLALENMSERGVTGTTPWTAHEITMRVDTGAVAIFFGALHPGGGTAWFDSFSVEVDGKPLTDLVGLARVPSAGEIAWLRKNAIPITSDDPAAPFADLRALGAAIGDARVVGLGEGTHGTAEFFRMKHRLTSYLAAEKGFTVFAIEANMPEARVVNEYVLTGRGDPKAALAGMYFWTWNTQEVLDLIEWMRRYNASGRGRMEFWGFDLQTPTVAMDSVRAFVARADSAFRPALDSSYSRIRDVTRERRSGPQSRISLGVWRAEAARVLGHLEARRTAYITAGQDSLDVAWAIQNARIVLQGANAAMGGVASRDSSMAANVEWILSHQPPGTKVVLWAHNGHVSRATGWMGSHLAGRFGDVYRPVGFAFGEGEYTAVGPRGLASYAAAPPPPGSVEAALRATGLPRLALDLRDAGREQASAWLRQPHDFRSIGAVAVDSGFSPTAVAKDYDLLIYFDRTRPTLRLSR